MSISSLIFGNGLYDTNTEKILRERIEENGIRIYCKAFENKHIQERINEEFMAISFYGNGALLLHASDVVKTAYKKGYPTSFHGNLGTSLVAFFLGLTGVNPLPFHCYCKECGYVKFYKSALDYKNRTAHKDSCVGMAANMIGVRKRIVAFDNEGKYMVMFNPEIIKKSEPYDTEEGCLSLLGGPRKCKRYQSIKVQWQTEKFETRIKTFTGWTAQIIQHEIDHCNGVLI